MPVPIPVSMRDFVVLGFIVLAAAFVGACPAFVFGFAKGKAFMAAKTTKDIQTILDKRDQLQAQSAYPNLNLRPRFNRTCP